MQALLITGETVELQKDCSCTHHDGPHWLHMDTVWHEMNRKLLAKGTFLALHGFAREENARLAEKLCCFEQYGIARIISTDVKK